MVYKVAPGYRVNGTLTLIANILHRVKCTKCPGWFCF